MRYLVCGRRSHYVWRMGKATAAMQCGFLVMLALVSGISALECHVTGSVQFKGSRVSTSKDSPMTVTTITCPEGENACMEAQVAFSTGESVVFVTDRGCAKKERIDGAASKMGDPYFGVRYNVRYCFKDLCNKEMSTDVAWSPLNDTEPEESGSNQCYSSLISWSPQRVTCKKGYSQCYTGNGFLRAGKQSVNMAIQTCRTPDCVAPQNFTFGPIEFYQTGSCCQGNYCNQIKTTPSPNPQTIPTSTGDLNKVATTSPPTSFTKRDAENRK